MRDGAEGEASRTAGSALGGDGRRATTLNRTGFAFSATPMETRCGVCGRLVRRSRARRPRLRWVNHRRDCALRGELPRAAARAEGALTWDLRAAWAAGWNVGVLLKGGRRVRGVVDRVASSGAFVVLWDGRGPLHVPLARVVAVSRPHFHEPEWGPSVEPRQLVPALELPVGQMSFEVWDGRPAGWVDPRAELQQRRGRSRRGGRISGGKVVV